MQTSRSWCRAENWIAIPELTGSTGMSVRRDNSPSGSCLASCAAKVAPRPESRPAASLIAMAVLLSVCASARSAEAQFYAGMLGGVSTLSGDARSIVDPSNSRFSSYNPENGLVLNALLGKHLSDFFTVQADYAWNRNSLTLSAAEFSPGSIAEYQEARQSSQDSVFGSGLVYFRSRRSRIRPYLSVGAGWVHLSSAENTITAMQGTPALPPHEFSANMIALRVPVGIDVSLRGGWGFRYCFSETLSPNPISNELSPPGTHSFKNFQNLFGIVRRF